jgi:hypothetical protein
MGKAPGFDPGMRRFEVAVLTFLELPAQYK